MYILYIYYINIYCFLLHCAYIYIDIYMSVCIPFLLFITKMTLWQLMYLHLDT